MSASTASCRRCRSPLVIDECVWCAERDAMDEMGDCIGRLLEKIQVLDPETWFTNAEDESLFINAFQMLVKWGDLYHQLRINDRLFTKEEAAKLEAAQQMMEPVRALLDTWAKRVPTRRRHLSAVDDADTEK